MAWSCVLVAPPVEIADDDSMDLLRNVYRHVAPLVACQLFDEIERWLLPRNGILRCIALNRGRSIEDCSVLGMDVVCNNVSHHFVHDTYYTCQTRVVFSLLFVGVHLKMFKNVVSCGSVKIDHDGMILLPSFFPCCSLAISIRCTYCIEAWQLFFVMLAPHGGRSCVNLMFLVLWLDCM